MAMRSVDLQNIVANAASLQRVMQAGREAQQAGEAAQAQEAQRAADKKSEQVDQPDQTKDKVIDEHRQSPQDRYQGSGEGEEKQEEQEKPHGDLKSRKRPPSPEQEGQIIDVEA